MTEETRHSYLRTHTLLGPCLNLDLAQAAAAAIDDARQTESGHSARLLARQGPLRLMVLGLAAGSFLEPHRVTGVMTLQLLQGVVGLTAAGDTYVMAPGQALVLDAGIAHALVAHADSALVLSIVRA